MADLEQASIKVRDGEKERRDMLRGISLKL